MYLYQYFLGNHDALGWAELRALKLYTNAKVLNEYDLQESGGNSIVNGLALNLFRGANQDSFYAAGDFNKFLRSFDSQYKDRKLFRTILLLSDKSPQLVSNLFADMGGPKKVAKVIAVMELTGKQPLFDFVLKNIIDIIRYENNKKQVGNSNKDANSINLKYTRINWYGQVNNIKFDFIKQIRGKLSEYFNTPVKLLGKNNQKVANTATTHKILKNNGIELNITFEKQTKLVIISKTIAVQNYKVFSVLEYKRPHRDMDVGMLPIKLALIMLNLAKVKNNSGFWDPMVGLGTLLMAGQLRGAYSYGSDYDHRAIWKTQENIAWLAKTGLVKQLKYRVFRFDITKDPMSNKILRDVARFGRFDAIVTEGYLGPTRTKPFVSKKQVAIWISKLNSLYTKFLKNVSPLLNQRGRVVFCTPIYKYYDKDHKIHLIPLVPPINKHRYNVITYNTGNLVWENRKSVVIRQIHILEKR